MRVRVSPLERGSISAFLETTATVESEAAVEIFPRSAGILVSLAAEEGDRVEKNRILAQVDPEQATLQEREAAVAFEEAQARKGNAALAVEEARARRSNLRVVADQAKREHERMLALSQPKDPSGPVVVSPKDLEAAKLAWDRAESEHALAELAVRKAESEENTSRIAAEKAKIVWELRKVDLEETFVRAPIAGVVSMRMVKEGQTVNLSTPAFTITDAARLRVVLPRPQRELPVLRPGLPLVATAEALPGREFRGEVVRVSPVVEAGTGNVRVTAHFERGEDGLRAGMLVRVKVTTDRKEEAVLVPKKAVFYEGAQATVFVVREGRAVRVPIEPGHADRDRLEILNVREGGLRLDDRVIVAGGAELRDGAPVEVVEE
jgi:membrane fusion protein (multidrug efflux system)